MAFLEWLIHETSIHSLVEHGSRDLYLILVSRFMRMWAWGGAALTLSIFLWTIGYKGTQIGTFLSLTLLGDAAISYILTFTADKIGRRRVLMIGSLLMIVAGTVFAFSKNWYLLLFSAIIGVISPGAHELGPFRAVQEATLAQLTPVEARTDVYAWFAVTSTVGIAIGLFANSWVTYIFREHFERNWKEALPVVFVIYAIMGLIKVVLTLFLTPRCEPGFVPAAERDDTDRETTAPLLNATRRRPENNKPATNVTATVQRIKDTVTVKMSPESRRILVKICFLFAINSFASGMLPITLMAWYASWRYRWFVYYRIGSAMAVVWLVASIAHLFSASVARRLGLVRAMVLMHLPTAIFVGLTPLAPGWKSFLVLLLLFSALSSMDQAPRTAFLSACFSESERTAVFGIINLVKTIASAGGPLLTGYFHDKKMWWATFVTAAILKVLYDIGLLVMFLNTKLPEHRRGPREVTVTDVDVGILLSENFRRPEEFENLEDDEMGEDTGPYTTRGGTKYEGIETIERV